MKAYIGTTGVLFALLTVAHLLRTEMWRRFATDPMEAWSYLLITLIAAALAAWAWKVFPRAPRSSS